MTRCPASSRRGGRPTITANAEPIPGRRGRPWNPPRERGGGLASILNAPAVPPDGMTSVSKIRLDQFDHSQVDRGRSRIVEALWILTKAAFFMTSLPWHNAWKRFLLRLFGAKIGRGVVLRPRINIHFPWKLEETTAGSATAARF